MTTNDERKMKIKFNGKEVIESKTGAIYFVGTSDWLKYDSPERMAAHLLIAHNGFTGAVYAIALIVADEESAWGPDSNNLREAILKWAKVMAAMAEFSCE